MTAAYRWPASLLVREKPPILVYLDQNHWIALAKAAEGHPDGHASLVVLEACRAARAAGRARFPLSSVHYAELLKVPTQRQRVALADTMAQLSHYETLLASQVVSKFEVDAVLDQMIGPRAVPLEPTPLIGHGVAWALLGTRAELRVMKHGRDVTDEVRARGWIGGPSSFDAWREEAASELERFALAGPKPTDVERLRENGWNPERFAAEVETRALQERQLKTRLDAEPRWRRGRLRDVVSAQEAISLMDEVNGAMRARNRGAGDWFTKREEGRKFIDSMPSADVRVTLRTSAHRNPQRAWATNDIHDIDALSVAVPYADIVVTEKHAHHVLHVAGIPSRTHTTVLRELADLIDFL